MSTKRMRDMDDEYVPSSDDEKTEDSSDSEGEMEERKVRRRQPSKKKTLRKKTKLSIKSNISDALKKSKYTAKKKSAKKQRMKDRQLQNEKLKSMLESQMESDGYVAVVNKPKKKRGRRPIHSSGLTQDDKGDIPLPEVPFGMPIRTEMCGFNIPYHRSDKIESLDSIEELNITKASLELDVAVVCKDIEVAKAKSESVEELEVTKSRKELELTVACKKLELANIMKDIEAARVKSESLQDLEVAKGRKEVEVIAAIDAVRESEVKTQLKNNSVLATILFTVFKRCFNTSNGQVGLFFATLYNSKGSYPVAVTHWSLWQRICMQCYSCFSPRSSSSFGIRKDAFKATLLGIMCKDVHQKDLEKLRAVTGADATAPTRVKDDSHVVISAYWIRYAYRILMNVGTIEELIHNNQDSTGNVFCNDRNLTLYRLGEYERFKVSSFKMVACQQSKVTAAAHFGSRVGINSIFNDLSPSFGVPWSIEQLKVLNTAIAFMNYELPSEKYNHHYTDIFTSVEETETRSREEIIQSLPNGVEDDSQLRPKMSNNFTPMRDVKAVTKIMKDHDIQPLRRGRPSKTLKSKAELKKKLLRNEEMKRGKRKIKNSDSVAVTYFAPNDGKKTKVVVATEIEPVVAIPTNENDKIDDLLKETAKNEQQQIALDEFKNKNYSTEISALHDLLFS